MRDREARRALHLVSPALVISLVTALLLPSLSSTAAAFCMLKVKANIAFVSWQTLPVTYRVSEDLTDPKLLDAIDKAFTAWGTVPCSKLSFKKGPSFKPCYATPCPAETVAIDHGTPYIYVFWVTAAFAEFVNPADPKVPYSSYPQLFQNNVGGIVGGSIAVNAKDYKFTTDLTGCTGATFHLQDFMMPLIARVIGLGESNVSPSASSLKGAFCSATAHALTADDKTALSYVYWDGSCTKPPQPGADGCSGTAPPPGDGQPPRTDGGVKPDGGGIPGREAGGAQCTSKEQCAPGETCDSTGHCVPESDDGCCRVGHAGREGSLPVLVMLLLLLALGLRRRR